MARISSKLIQEVYGWNFKFTYSGDVGMAGISSLLIQEMYGWNLKFT